MTDVHPQRIRTLKESSLGKNQPVLYWMQRDKRVSDNWALIFAQELAIQRNVPLLVCFNYIGNFSESNLRQYEFLFYGLEETAKVLKELNIDFYLVKGSVEKQLIKFINSKNIGTIVTDFSPINFYKKRIKTLTNKISIPFYQVDAHNIVPIWESSDKQEWAAYTLRPKIIKRLSEFLVEYPKIVKHPVAPIEYNSEIIFEDVLAELKIDRSIRSVGPFLPGEKMAMKILKKFKSQSIDNYNLYNNNPNFNVLTNLSPYLHYGHIAPQRVALELSNLDCIENKSIMEQLIIRRELADNFCYYNLIL